MFMFIIVMFLAGVLLHMFKIFYLLLFNINLITYQIY